MSKANRSSRIESHAKACNPMDTAFAVRFPLYGARQIIWRDNLFHFSSYLARQTNARRGRTVAVSDGLPADPEGSGLALG